jgi:hypothetical protein
MAKTNLPATAAAPSAAPSTDVMSDEDRRRMLADAASDGMAFEKEDLAVPFLRIAQDLTPQTKKHEPSYIAGLEPGDLYHTVTGEMWKNPVGAVVVPVAFTRSFTEWWPRNSKQGKGFVKDWGVDGSELERCTRDDKNRDITERGTQITRAALYFVLVVNPETGEYQQAALSLSGTQLKHAKKWNALISQYKMRGIPGFGKCYRLTTVIESNDQGSWSALHVEAHINTLQLPNGAEIYEAAKAYAGLVATGAVQVKHEDQEPTGAEGDGAKVPF